MKKALSLVVTLMVPLLFFSFMQGIPAKAHTEEEITALIENASTPEDHMKLAEYYEKRAMKTEGQVRFHEAMEKAYRKRTKATNMPKHCAALSAKYKEATAEYRAMAAEHRNMAKDLR